MVNAAQRRGMKLSGPDLPGRGAISRATRFIDGGRKRFLEYVQMAALDGDADAKRFWAVFTDLKLHEQIKVSFDDVCVAADISPSDLMGIVVSTGMEHEMETGDIVAASLHAKLVHQTGRSAMRIGGAYADIAQKDRVAMLQHARFLPIPRNASMQVNVNASANAQAAAAAAADPSMPSFMEDVGSLRGSKDHVRKALIGETPATDAEVVED